MTTQGEGTATRAGGEQLAKNTHITPNNTADHNRVQLLAGGTESGRGQLVPTRRANLSPPSPLLR